MTRRFHSVGAAPAELSFGTPHRRLDRGHSEPIVFQLEDRDGPAGLWVVKMPSETGCGTLSFVRELFGAELAARLDIDTPAVGLARVPRHPPPSAGDELGRRVARLYATNAGRLSFCSAYVPGGEPDNLHDMRRVGTRRQAAARIYVLDAWTEHYDRSETNPNLLQREDTLIAIDHERLAAIASVLLPSGEPAWEASRLRDPSFLEKHCCRTVVDRGGVDLITAVVQQIEELDDATLEAIGRSWPPELDRNDAGEPAGVLRDLRAFTRARRSHVRSFLSPWCEPPTSSSDSSGSR